VYIAFDQFRDCEEAVLKPGNMHSAEGVARGIGAHLQTVWEVIPLSR